ncbi:hypothetical protein BST61_g9192 [Cercospora zeina]
MTSLSLHPPSRAITPSPLSATFDACVHESPTPSLKRPIIQDNDFATLPNTAPTLIIVDAEPLLTKIRHTESALSQEFPISVRCRAISKCVWREWRELLYNFQGLEMSTEDLIQALTSTFEKSVIDYGWETDWRELDEGFVKVMQMIAESVGATKWRSAE